MSIQIAINQMSIFSKMVSNVAEIVDRLIIRRLIKWHNRRIAIAELNRLDDRMLADIGLMRSEIPQVIDGMLRASVKADPQPPPSSRI